MKHLDVVVNRSCKNVWWQMTSSTKDWPKIFRFHSFEIFDGVLQMKQVVLNIPLQAQSTADLTTVKNLA